MSNINWTNKATKYSYTRIIQDDISYNKALQCQDYIELKDSYLDLFNISRSSLALMDIDFKQLLNAIKG